MERDGIVLQRVGGNRIRFGGGRGWSKLVGVVVGSLLGKWEDMGGEWGGSFGGFKVDMG